MGAVPGQPVKVKAGDEPIAAALHQWTKAQLHLAGWAASTTQDWAAEAWSHLNFRATGTLTCKTEGLESG